MPKTKFGDFTAATRLRDVIRSIVASEIEKARPAYRYGVVRSIDTANGLCKVAYTDSDPTGVTVRMGLIIRPTTVGQIVRVDGLSTDRFIADVLK
jgi:hypothetical protein